jgi:predicted dinucleotide-binding enzyme
MKIALLGTGTVAQTIAPMLEAKGHAIRVGSRNPAAAPAGLAMHAGSARDAIATAEVVINALPGAVSVDALSPLAAELTGKTVIDLSNAISQTPEGFELVYPNASVGAALQAALPQARVVKAMNSMSAAVIADPIGLAAPIQVFIAGNDAAAKAETAVLLTDLGWPAAEIVDLGGIEHARGPEHTFLLLASLFGVFGTPRLGLAVVR